MSLIERVKEIESEFINYRRKVHQNPELGFEEYETCRLIEEFLHGLGIETRKNGDKTGVIGLLKGEQTGDKVIALRADMDALKLTEATGLEFASKNPGVCHACGHDMHVAVLLGTAKMLVEHKADFRGTVKFLFQPAEEMLGGSESMIANGVMENPKVDYILAAHTWPEMPVGSIGVRKGAVLGSADSFTITITGKGVHAAHPHKGIDPIVVGAYIITELQTVVSRRVAPLDSAVVSIGRLSAGTVSNIIPTECVMEGTVRTQDPETRKMMADCIKTLVTHVATGMGATAKIDYKWGVPPTLNDPFIIDALSDAVKELLGKDKLLQVPIPSMGAEDFARYLDFAPGAFFRIGTADERPETRGALHNPETLFSEKAISAGIVAFVGAVFKLTGSDMAKLK
jgi:amidohydrolase/hippurate hydrolase